MSLKTENRKFREIKRMMEMKPKHWDLYVADRCEECEYYHPDWKYRTCFFVECPYGRKKFTLRPLAQILKAEKGLAYV